MKRFLLLALALFVCSIGLVGCGGKDDTSNTTAPGGDKMAAPGGDKMGSPGTDKMGAATGSGDAVKDKVDSAIKADDKLKDASITVDHKDGKVILKGSVADNAAKKEAADVTTKAITDAGSSDKLQNMITVKSH